MRYLFLLIFSAFLFAQQQMPIIGIDTKGEREERGETHLTGMTIVNLGEDTEIVMQDPKRDTVFTIDDVVMDIEPDKIALSEMYYPLDVENVVAVDQNGRAISLEEVPIKGYVRARLVKRGNDFVVVRIRVLRFPR